MQMQRKEIRRKEKKARKLRKKIQADVKSRRKG